MRLRDLDTGNIPFQSENQGAFGSSSKRFFVRFGVEVWELDEAGAPTSVLAHDYDARDRDVLINGFEEGDTIDLAGVNFSGGASAQLLFGNMLQIVTGGSNPLTYDLNLGSASDFAGDTLELSPDAGPGIDVSLNPHLSINASYDSGVTALDTPGNAAYARPVHGIHRCGAGGGAVLRG